MHATSVHSSSPRAGFGPLLVTLTLLGAASIAHAQSCDISASPAAPVAGQAFSICGPAGASTYTWLDAAGNPVGSQACLDYPSGLPAGTYDWTLIVAQGPYTSFCSFELSIADAPPPPPPCAITVSPAGALCAGQAFTLCGPAGAGLTWAWYDATGALMGQEQCLSVAAGQAAGSWSYSLTVSNGTASASCGVAVRLNDCATHVPNCPRGAGFWAQACERRGMAIPQLSADQMARISAAADARSAFFDWSGARTLLPAGSLCAALNPARPMDARKQAKRQYAALLANVSAGVLGIRTRTGQMISLDPSTPIACASPATTIGELITDVDQQLGQLETQSLDATGVQGSYDMIAACCEAANEGVGIPLSCPGTAAAAPVMAAPNPFSVQTQVEYQVETGGEPVDLAVYDVTGRLVERLASGWQPAGQYHVHWDGRNANGVTEPSGVFFVRGTIGDRPIAARLLLLR